MNNNIAASVQPGFDAFLDFLRRIYGVIFPEFPDIGLCILCLCLVVGAVHIVKGEPGGTFRLVLGLFVSLTALALFLHLAIKLFLMMAMHTL